MKISLGCDHAGYELKEAVKAYLQSQGHEVQDFGAHSEESEDYPDFIIPAAESVARGEAERGIVFGGSGNGEAIAANKVKGIRCALCWNEESARLAREHNDANLISLGGRFIDAESGVRMVEQWLSASFQDGRHLRRIRKIAAYERGNGG